MSLAPPQLELLRGEWLNMLSCIRCGQCLTSCPTYVLSMNEAEGPRGRIALMRALTEGHLTVTPDLVEHEQNCLVCDACTAVCPAGVHMDPMQVALRAALEGDAKRPGAGASRPTPAPRPEARTQPGAGRVRKIFLPSAENTRAVLTPRPDRLHNRRTLD